MFESYNFKGRKISVANIEEAVKIVQETYPNVVWEGSAGHWTWFTESVDGLIVAEAWLQQKEGWWLKISPKGGVRK